MQYFTIIISCLTYTVMMVMYLIINQIWGCHNINEQEGIPSLQRIDNFITIVGRAYHNIVFVWHLYSITVNNCDFHRFFYNILLFNFADKLLHNRKPTTQPFKATLLLTAYIYIFNSFATFSSKCKSFLRHLVAFNGNNLYR